MDKQPAVYILTNKVQGTLYTGVTSNLAGRMWLHKNGLTPGFARRYNLHKLVYFEIHSDMYQAITREKQLKAGPRKAKLRLIDEMNPTWRDMSGDLNGG